MVFNAARRVPYDALRHDVDNIVFCHIFSIL